MLGNLIFIEFINIVLKNCNFKMYFFLKIKPKFIFIKIKNYCNFIYFKRILIKTNFNHSHKFKLTIKKISLKEESK